MDTINYLYATEQNKGKENAKLLSLQSPPVLTEKADELLKGILEKQKERVEVPRTRLNAPACLLFGTGMTVLFLQAFGVAMPMRASRSFAKMMTPYVGLYIKTGIASTVSIALGGVLFGVDKWNCKKRALPLEKQKEEDLKVAKQKLMKELAKTYREVFQAIKDNKIKTHQVSMAIAASLPSVVGRSFAQRVFQALKK